MDESNIVWLRRSSKKICAATYFKCGIADKWFCCFIFSDGDLLLLLLLLFILFLFLSSMVNFISNQTTSPFFAFSFNSHFPFLYSILSFRLLSFFHNAELFRLELVFILANTHTGRVIYSIYNKHAHKNYRSVILFACLLCENKKRERGRYMRGRGQR